MKSEYKVLTGELGPGGPEWAKKAAKISQPNEGGRRWMLWSQHCTTCDGGEDCSNEDFGRCYIARLKGRHLTRFVPSAWSKRWKPRYSTAVPRVVVGICWNGRACMLWPFLHRERPMGAFHWPLSVEEWPQHARSAIPTATL